MKKIIVEIEFADDIDITAKSIEDKFNFKLLNENKISVTQVPDDCIIISRNRLRDISWFAVQYAGKLEAKERFEGRSGVVRRAEIDNFVDYESSSY